MQVEAIITELIFEHALRIRIVADAPESTTGPTRMPAERTQQLVGKINNLVSSDLGIINAGREWPSVVLYAPLQILLCIVFL